METTATECRHFCASSRRSVSEETRAPSDPLNRATRVTFVPVLAYLLGIILATTPQVPAEEERLPVRSVATVLAEVPIERGGAPVIVPITVEGHGDAGKSKQRRAICRMHMDTGAAHTFFDVAHRALLGNAIGTVDLLGATPDNVRRVETFKAPVMRIRGLTLAMGEDDTVGCCDLSSFADGFGEKIDGILGMDVLRHLVFSMDFDDGTLRLYRSLDPTSARRVPLLWGGDAFPGCPVVRAALDGGATQEFLVDTGGAATFCGTIDAHEFDRLSKEACIVPAVPGSPDLQFPIFTTGARVDATLWRARRLSLGGYAHEGLVFARFPISCVGLGYLSRYWVAFDFPNSAMYLRPGKAFARRDAYDLSGLTVSRRGGAIVVTGVSTGGAGAAARMRVGDTIMHIDGTSARELSLFALWRVFCVEGRHVVNLTRDGTQRRVALVLDNALQGPTVAELSRRWALLIGVDHYEHANDLKFCANGQCALASRLIDSGFERDGVFLLHGEARNGKQQPRKAYIEEQLARLLKRVKPGDAIFVSFSGHAVVSRNIAYLCPTDGDPGDPSTLISLDDIVEKIAKSPAALKLLLIDCCRHETMPDDRRQRSDDPRLVSKVLGRMEPPPGVLLWNSCSEGEFAKDDRDLRHGVFMHFVLEGLQGGADTDNDRNVSARELANYADHKTQLYVATKFSASQQPLLRGNPKAAGLTYELFALAKPGETIVNTIGMKLVLIPEGTFEMGLHASLAELEKTFGKLPDSLHPEIVAEQPAHPVRITRPIFMGVHEVTKGQFAEFVEDDGYETDAERGGRGGWGWNATEGKFDQKPAYTWRSWGFEQTDDHPVANVSFNDATAFCGWLSEREGKTYRLPTEAEWEYACRAGTTSHFYNGDDPEGIVEIGNLVDETAVEAFGSTTAGALGVKDGYAFTAPGGRFRANAFGLYDMTGNVAEWCSDCYEVNYYAKSQQSDPHGPFAPGAWRVHRGGSWTAFPLFCRSTHRSSSGPAFRRMDIGFRVVRVR